MTFAAAGGNVVQGPERLSAVRTTWCNHMSAGVQRLLRRRCSIDALQAHGSHKTGRDTTTSPTVCY